MEAEVDWLITQGKMIDLYKVVKGSIMVSQPSYSIKKLEAFYEFGRKSTVVDAGSSIEEYDYFRQLTEVPAEMTWSKGLLASDELRASANLLFSDGVLTAQAFNLLPWQNPPADESNLSAWEVANDSLENYFTGNPSIISGTDGLVNPEARLIIFGDNPAGKWKVWFGFVLEVQ
jgi:hypothetical protein